MNDWTAVAVYVAYVSIAVGLTAWLARTLYKSGTAFLHDVFADRPALADAVNRLLVVGFYMANLGYALWIVRASRGLDAFAAAHFLTQRLAVLLVTLAVLHFVNVTVFWLIRSRREQRQMPPPVAPHVVVPAPAGEEG